MAGSGGFIDVSFAYDGAKDIVSIQRKLATFGKKIASLAPAWEEVGTNLLQDFSQNFAQEGGFFGGYSRWPQLAASTVAERTRLGYSGAHPILQRTGALRDSVSVRGAPGNIFEVEDNGLTIGTDIPYAIYHNSSAARKRLPRRAIVSLSNQRKGFGGQSGSVIDTLNQYIKRQISGSGL